MARIRSVHPSLFTDEAWVSCSPLARLLVIGLWTDADDQGVFEWKPLQLKMRLLPGDTADTASLLEELANVSLIMRFEVDGKGLGAIRDFRKFQRPQKPNAIHPLPSNVAVFVGLSDTTTGPFEERSATPTVKSPQMEDVGGRREDTVPNPAAAEIEPPRADDWPTGDLQSHRQALLALAGPGMGDPAREAGLFTTIAEIDRWRRMGCSWSLDVVPIVVGRTAKPRTSPLRTWSALTGDVLGAKARREAEVQTPNVIQLQATGPPSNAAAAMREEGRRRALAQYEADG